MSDALDAFHDVFTGIGYLPPDNDGFPTHLQRLKEAERVYSDTNISDDDDAKKVALKSLISGLKHDGSSGVKPTLVDAFDQQGLKISEIYAYLESLLDILAFEKKQEQEHRLAKYKRKIKHREAKLQKYEGHKRYKKQRKQCKKELKKYRKKIK